MRCTVLPRCVWSCRAVWLSITSHHHTVLSPSPSHFLCSAGMAASTAIYNDIMWGDLFLVRFAFASGCLLVLKVNAKYVARFAMPYCCFRRILSFCFILLLSPFHSLRLLAGSIKVSALLVFWDCIISNVY